MSLWHRVHQLFERDDGSLPDIFIKPLSKAEIVAVYEWVMSRCSVFGEPTAWHLIEQRDVPLSAIPQPAKAFVDGTIEMFRHGLSGLSFNGSELPPLTICVEPGGVSFDYRKGHAWDARTVAALFALLSAIKGLAPGAVVSQAEEGCESSPSKAFSEAFEAYVASDA